METFSLQNLLDLKWFKPATFKTFEFASEEYFWLLWFIPAFFLIKVFIPIISKKLEVALLEKDIKFQWASLFRFIPPIILSLTIACMIVALARPQLSNDKVEKWSEGIDIMLALDISRSMEGMDFKPNRLEAAKNVAVDFIDGRFQDRIGLVVFAGEAYSKAPLTGDYDLLKDMVKSISFDEIQADGTAIGSALGVAVDRLKESPAKSKVIILLSDGESNQGNINPMDAAKLAYTYNMKIYCIGVGKEGKVPYEQEVQDIFGNKSKRTFYQENTLNEAEMKSISKIADGQYFRATNNKALQSIFKKIDLFEKTEIHEERYKSTKEYYYVYLFWGIVFLSVWFLTKSTFLTNALED